MNRKIEVNFDSNEILYNLKVSESHMTKSFGEIKKYLLNKKLIDILEFDFKNFPMSLEVLGLISDIRHAIYDYRGDTFFLDTREEKENDLVCRCNKLFKSDIEKIYKSVKGVTKSFYQESNASMLCGGCREQVKENLESVASDFYEGKSLTNF
jgi:hypothetical protein